MRSEVDYDECPIAAFREPFRRYVEEHVETGGFLRAVLENDLREAVVRADPASLYLLRELVWWCNMQLPSPCWGSVECVRHWLTKPARDAANRLDDSRSVDEPIPEVDHDRDPYDAPW